MILNETTVLFAFTSKNAVLNTAKLYKGRFTLKFKVQSRQLRASHIDAQYCAAQFRYMREYTVKLRDITIFLCLDDKAKIDYGEPDLAISSGVRGKKIFVPINTVLGHFGHDVKPKGSLTFA